MSVAPEVDITPIPSCCFAGPGLLLPSTCSAIARGVRAEYSSVCYTAKHNTYMAFAALIFAVVSIMTPAYLGYYISKNRHEFLDKDPTHTPSALALGLGFFYRSYKEKKIHWEVVELFGKLAVTSVVVFIE